MTVTKGLPYLTGRIPCLQDEVTVDLLTFEVEAESSDTSPAPEAQLESVADEESVAPIEGT